MKKVSVIMPYYKKISFFEEAYNSVLSQNYSNIEIIIIYDDYDLTELSFVKKIINNRKNTTLIVNKKNCGVGLSRNIGINRSRGFYITFLDCDDVWKKNKLRNQVFIMNKLKLDFSFTGYNVINENNNFLYNVPAKDYLTHADLLKSCDIGLSTVMIKRQILKRFKFSRMITKEDYLLWLQISKNNTKIYGIKKSLSLWRKCNNSLSSNIVQKIKDAFNIYYKHEKQGFIKSLISIIILSFFAYKKKLN
ncbi:Glycosyltransferase 2-like [Candidatus Pelagibacterales bacterium]|jgi:teichuronic acid biosynthesis glycosyltransferase TuaG